MFYYSDDWLDSLLLSDIEYGDLTTRSLGIGDQLGSMTFARKFAGRVSGIDIAAQLLKKLSLDVDIHFRDGTDASDGAILLTAYGNAARLHQGWKVTQNILEWSCGVANYMSEMVSIVRSINPAIRIACTRKSIPCTKPLAVAAICHGGGILHRAGTAETILLFANHRHFFSNPNDWTGMMDTLRLNAPEKKIIVEADDINEAFAALSGKPDILQLDKFKIDDVKKVISKSYELAPNCTVSVTGGIDRHNILDFARAGVHLIITSSPYYALPDDIKVILRPIS